MISVSSATLAALFGLIALLGTALGAAAAYGALRNTVAQLLGLVAELRAEVKTLSTVVSTLSSEVAVLRALDEREAGKRP